MRRDISTDPKTYPNDEKEDKMNRKNLLIIVICSLAAAAVGLCAAISVSMTKACEQNKPCTVSLDLFRRKDKGDGD